MRDASWSQDSSVVMVEDLETGAIKCEALSLQVAQARLAKLAPLSAYRVPPLPRVFSLK